ncbi:DUF3592 domain-containing protein [Chitinophaga polysaccharea]|uniref:DUF3592 domain-containing protein n=1 Tax=Chitinophaga polysaccharea TaxID=1293035 RepID=UPI00115AF7E1|nr:DUF3592 domain-containing protein [Chitinophaga polysaccharea]
MKRSSVSLVFNIFLGVGIVTLIITLVILYNVKKFNDSAVKTSGTVVDLIAKRGSKSTTYSPVVTFNDNAGVKHRYISDVSSSPAGYNIGDNVEICYNPNDPDDAKIAGWRQYFGAFITGAFALIFGLIGLGYHIVRKVGRSRQEQLKQSGQLVPASFISVDVNRYVSVNRRHPFFIRCEWKDPLTGITHPFKSGFIWSDPTPYIERDKKIDVYVDRNNFRKYYVDISSFER